MFAGAQIITTKLVHRSRRKELIDAQIEDRTAQDLSNMAVVIPRSKAAIVVETRLEKHERKALAQERRQERLLEQQTIAQQMEHLMEKVIHETPLSRKDEDHLRHKIKTIMTKVNKQSDKLDVVPRQSSLIEPRSSTVQLKSDSVESSHLHSKPTNQGAFLLWYNKSLH